jgi:hypothetical protein
MLLGEGTLTLSPTLEVLTFFFLSTIDDILSTSCLSVGGEWKVGLGKGKIPTKSNKITVSGTGIILKINK